MVPVGVVDVEIGEKSFKENVTEVVEIGEESCREVAIAFVDVEIVKERSKDVFIVVGIVVT